MEPVISNPIVLTGPLDQYAAEILKEQALSLLSANSDAVFDFTEVDRMHTASLQVLLALQKDLAKKGKAVVLHGVEPRVRELFRISGAENSFQFLDGTPLDGAQ